MKKYYSFIILLCFLISSLSCRKKKISEEPETVLINSEMRTGLPEDTKHINGYLYVNSGPAILWDTTTQDRLILYANFSDPALDLFAGFNHYSIFRNITKLNGNLDVGPVKFNDTTVVEKAIFFPKICFMDNVTRSDQPDTIHWTTVGTRGYKPIDEIVPHGFPEIHPAILDTLRVHDSYSLDVKDRVTNYDSVTVTISSKNFSAFKTISKNGGSVLTFTSEDLSGIAGDATDALVMITAYNYRYKIIENKIYVFEAVRQAKIDIVPVKH